MLSVTRPSATAPAQCNQDGLSAIVPLAVPCTWPNEILCTLFDKLPSRQLVQLKAVSPHFSNVVDYTLRCRLLKIVKGDSHEVFFQSGAPHETRQTRQRVVRLSHFEFGHQQKSSDVGHFVFAAPVSEYLTLDCFEMFSTLSLSLHLRTVPPMLPTPPSTPPQLRPDPAGQPSWSPPTQQRWTRPPVRQFDYIVSLGGGHARLFRTPFEDERHASTSTGRLMEQHVLKPTGSQSALVSGTIQCARVPPSPDSPLRQSSALFDTGTYTAATPSLFEYYFESIQVDVGRFVVNVEEALSDSPIHFVFA